MFSAYLVCLMTLSFFFFFFFFFLSFFSTLGVWNIILTLIFGQIGLGK